MDYSTIIKELKQASLFDLHRIQVVIMHLLENPERLESVKNQLQPGQIITYFDSKENRLIAATVIRLKRTRLLVEDVHDKQRWNIPFYWVNLDDVDTIITTSPSKKLEKSELQVGDEVSFRDRQNNDVYGQIIRLNQKTATILTDNQTKWRVAYALLHLVVEGERGHPNLIEGVIIDPE